MGLHLFRVSMYIDGFRGVLYTGKIVKSMLIRSIPGLEELFKPVKGPIPKLIHITPLFMRRGNGVIKCIYSYIDCGDNDTAKCSGRPVEVKLNGLYHFYLGFSDKIVDPETIMNGLIGSDTCIEYGGRRICMKIYEIEYRDPRHEAVEIAGEVLRSGRVKIVFASPAMLRDPFRRAKYKSLLPNVWNIFSTPLYTMLYDHGIYSLKKYRRQLIMLYRIFNEPYTVLKTVRIKWVVYKRKPEPTLIGYVKLYINNDYLEYYSRYIDMKNYLGEIFTYMTTLGVGVGRATGFGHVFLEA